MSQTEIASATGTSNTSTSSSNTFGNASSSSSASMPTNTYNASYSSSHAMSSGLSSSEYAKKIPESFGKLVTANDTSKPIPQSLGTDIGAINVKMGEKMEDMQKQNSILQEENGTGFSGTLLTEDAHMEYDELTGDLHRVGESIDDYFFDFNPDTPLNKPLLDSFKNFALENKMSIATAKKIAHFYDEQMQKSNREHLAKSHEEQIKMRNICAHDPEIGGAKFHENLRLAKAGIRRFDNEGSLAKILDETGFGSHPEVLRFMHRVGKAFAESPMVTGAKPKRELSTAELFYPSMRKK